MRRSRAGGRRAPIEFLKPNPRNPRKRFDDAELDELAASIKERGVIQPILVRAVPRVAGRLRDRRRRAALAGRPARRPARRTDRSDRGRRSRGARNRHHRKRPARRPQRPRGGRGLRPLGADYGYSHADVARVVGKSRSHIANTLRLTNLPDHTKKLLAEGKISAGHGRALLAVANPDATADRIVSEGLTVRDIERLGENAGKAPRAKKAPPALDPDTAALQDKLGLALGAKVTIRYDGESGDIRIAFRNFEQLDDFCRRLCQPPSP